MNEYQEILEKVAVKEMTVPIILSIILLILLVIVWMSSYRHFMKMKKKHINMYKSSKKVKGRKQCFWALIAISVIGVGFSTLLLLDAVDTVSAINKDINENSYMTYKGEYYINEDGYTVRYMLYDRWVSVDFENGDWAYLYINDVFEAFGTDRGECSGKVVYGKNSLIVVDIIENETVH